MITCISLNASLGTDILLQRDAGPLDEDQPITLGPRHVVCKAVNTFRGVHAQEPGSHRLLVSLGGETGSQINASLAAAGLPFQPLRRESENRRTLVIQRPDSARSWEWKAPCELTAPERDAIAHSVGESVSDGEITVIAGSPPALTEGETWLPLFENLRQHGARLLLDSSGWGVLVQGGVQPWILKVNRREWCAGTGQSTPTPPHIRECLREWGLHAVIITDGTRGALAVTDSDALRALPPAGRTGFTIGCGDAFNAGLVVSLHREQPLETALVNATACAVSNMSSTIHGEIRADDLPTLRREVKIEEGSESRGEIPK